MKNFHNKNSNFNNCHQQGVSFIEVIVALVILATGILGAVAMQATAKQASFDAMQRSVASSLAQGIIARMRANAPSINPDLTLVAYALDTYGESIDGVPSNRCDNAVTPCTPLQMSTNDRYEWELALMGGDTTQGTTSVGGLVGGRACIFQNANAYSVVISWQGRTNTADAGASYDNTCGSSGSKRRQIEVKAFIY